MFSLLELSERTVGGLELCAGPVTVRSKVPYSFLGFDIKLTISFFILSSYYLLFLELFFSRFLCKEEDYKLIESLISPRDFFLPVFPLDDHFVVSNKGLSNFSFEDCCCIPLPCVTLKSSNFSLISSS